MSDDWIECPPGSGFYIKAAWLKQRILYQALQRTLCQALLSERRDTLAGESLGNESSDPQES